MSKRLYVGNLPFSTTEDTLHAMFSEKGQVTSAKLIMDKFSGRSKGFGFIDMVNDNEAEEAINTLNNFESDGRKLVVNEARPMEKREGGFNRGGAGGAGGGGGGFKNKRSW